MKALLVVDMQNDFMPGGPLGVPNANQLIPIINSLTMKFAIVIATKDWHPADHVSFATNHAKKKPGDYVEVKGMQQLLWPPHCVQHTKGAELAPGLNKERICSLVFKGTDKWIDSYSAFYDNAHLRSTGLDHYLHSRLVTQVYICGVATDYCVLYSTLDALQTQLEIFVITDACRGIDVKPKDTERALATMKQKGARLIISDEIKPESVGRLS